MPTKMCSFIVVILRSLLLTKPEPLFTEWRFNLPPLTERDAHANNLLNAFDFSQKPRPPHIIPLSQAQIDEVKRYMEG
jgi:hypothetical protein